MLVWDQRKRTREAWAWIGAVAAAALLLVALASPMSAAAPTKTTLSNAVVSPRTGTTATTILISVVARNADGARADSVTVMVGGADHAMTRLSGGSWGKGVTFSWSGKLPSGTHAVILTARAKNQSEATLPAGTVTIAPDPTPKPPAGPRATPTPDPTATPAPRRTAAPTPRPTPKPTPRSTVVPIVVVEAVEPTMLVQPPDVPTTEAVQPTTPVLPPDVPTMEASPTASAPPVTAMISGSSGPGGSSGGGSDTVVLPGHAGAGRPAPWGPVAGLFALGGLPAPSLPSFSLGPTLVTTTGAVAAAMAFGLFGRRRRDDDDPSDELMAVAAARGLEVVPVALAGATTVGHPIDGMESDLGLDVAGDEGASAGIDELEALMPRWRRPSLLQARKADPIRDSMPGPRLRFDQGLVGPLDGRERRVIRYRVVRLLDSPDELRGAEIGYLDQGDEVQLLEKYGAYWLVLCPDGRQGWLHKMTLGEIIDEDGPSEGPVATMPVAADSWTMGEADIDSDVFAAYLESQRRRRA